MAQIDILNIDSPFDVYFDNDGTPLDAGQIYIGEAGKSAESYPIDVYWDDDLTRLASQPLGTVRGYIIDGGDAGKPRVSYATIQNYSMTIRNKRGELVYSRLSAASGVLQVGESTTTDTTTVNNTAAVRSLPVVSGQSVYRKAHKNYGDGGGIHFIGITNKAVGTYADNDGTYIVPIGGDGSSAWVADAQVVSTAAFGASDKVVDAKAAMIRAIEYAAATGVKLVGSVGIIPISGQLDATLTESLDFEIPAGCELTKTGSWSGDMLNFTLGDPSHWVNVHGGGLVNGVRVANGFDGTFLGPIVLGGDAAITGYIIVKDSAGTARKLAVIT